MRSILPGGGAAAILLFFSPMVIGRKGFVTDGQLAAYFEWPALWSGDWAAGWPVFADPISMPLYPIRILFVLIGLPFDAFVVSAYLIAYLGTYLLLVRWVDSVSAILGAMGFALSGWMLVHLSHTSMIHAAAWAPWMLLGLAMAGAEGVRERRIGTLAIATTTIFCCLAGHPQIFVYAMFLASLFACFVEPGLLKTRRFLIAMTAMISGIGLSSFSLIPTWQLSMHTFRESLAGKTFFEYALPLDELPGLLVPLAFGSTPYGWFRQEYATPGSSGETITVVPAMMILLAATAMAARRFNKKIIVFMGALIPVSLLLALGDAIWPFGLITENMPGLNMFRAPSRHLMETSLAVAVLAGFGSYYIRHDNDVSPLSKALYSVCALFTVAVLVIAMTGHAPTSEISSASPYPRPVLVAIVMLGLSALILLSTRVLNKAQATGLIFLVFIFQLYFYGYQLPWRVYAPEEKVHDEPAWVRDFREQISVNYRVLGLDGWQGQVFNPDLSRLFGLRALGWYGPLLNRQIAELTGVTTGGWTRREVLTPTNRALDVTSVRFVSIGVAERATLEANPERWNFVRAYGDELVYENKKALPRARVVCDIIPVADSQRVLEIVHNSDALGMSLSDTALVVGGGESRRTSNCGLVGGAHITEDSGARLAVSVESDSAGYLVIADTWYPGWTAKVNGRDSPILGVNHALRAVPIEAGRTTVVFRFVPEMGASILFVTLLSAGLLLLLLKIASAGSCSLHTRHVGGK